MNFPHQLTLMRACTLPFAGRGTCSIQPVKYEWVEFCEEFSSYPCGPEEAEGWAVHYGDDRLTYTLAECPDFKTADAFVKIIDSLLQSFSK